MSAKGSEPWGFVGLGEMGEPMARNLVAAGGRPVAVFDRDEKRMRALEAEGAHPASTLPELAAASDVVSVCVRDAAQVAAVLDELEGALPPGALVVLHTTMGPAAARAAAERLVAHGIACLDAPISGMRMAAADGRLSFFAGGGAVELERARPGLEAMGRTILHVGEVGAGQVAKVLNNLVAFSTLGIVSEAIAIGAAAGVDEATLLEVFASGSASSWVVANFEFLARLWRESQPGGTRAIREIVAKDLGLGANLGREVGARIDFAKLAERLVVALYD